MSRHVMEASQQLLPVGRMPRLNIELTERCDNDCVHCCINRPQADSEARERELTASRLKQLLNEAAELGCLQVRFTGGEPLLRDDFSELYVHARRLGMRVMIFSNGRRITPELASLFARIPPLLPIEVTVYGMTARAYESITRVPGSYQEFIRGIGELSQRHIPYVVKWVDLPADRAEYDDFCAWARTIPAMKQPAAVIRILQLRDRRDDQQKNRLIADLRLDPKSLAALLNGTTRREHGEIVDFCKRFLGTQGDSLFTYGIGEAPSIDAYGQLQPCHGIRVPGLTYDLSTGCLRDAVTNFFPSLHKKKATNSDYLTRCAQCFLKGLCEQCPAKSWGEHGTLDTPVEYLCALAHEQARQLGLLKGGESGWEVTDWQQRINCLNPIEKIHNL